MIAILSQPTWLKEAYKHKGLKEVPGVGDNPIIQTWLKRLGAWWDKDSVAWCGVFTGWCLKAAGFPIPKNYFRAKEWLTYGEACGAEYGAIAVLGRVGGGHVGFVTAVAPNGDFQLLGGNQGDKVCEVWFKKDRALGFRKPTGAILSKITTVVSTGELSKSEA